MGQSLLECYTGIASQGTKAAVDELMGHLNMDMSIAESKILDYALSLVCTDEGFITMEHYLHHGTQIQRNYCALYFIRRGEHLIVRSAYDLGRIDKLQAFTR